MQLTGGWDLRAGLIFFGVMLILCVLSWLIDLATNSPPSRLAAMTVVLVALMVAAMVSAAWVMPMAAPLFER